MLNIQTQIRTDLNPSKRIQPRIRPENIRTVFTPARQYRRKLDTGQQHVVWEKIVLDRPSAKSVSPIDGNLASSRAKDQIEADTTARHSSRSIIPMWKHKHTTLDIPNSAASYMYDRGKTLRINYSMNLRQAWMIGQIDRVISQQELLRLRYFVRVHQMGSNATFFHIACRERGYIVRETCQAREPTAGEQ